MAHYHVYSQTVADGTATSVVRPSDWNSAHSQVMTLAGNTAGASTISGTNVIFQGGNNVTLSANQAANVATVVFSAANQSVQTQASGSIVGAGFTSTTIAGVNVAATHNSQGLSMAIPQYITTFQNDLTSGRAGTGFTSTTTAGTAVVGTLNTNGLSMGVPAYITTYQNDFTSGRAGTGFTSTTTAGTAIVATQNTAGLSMGVPAYITTYAAQTNQTQASGNIAGVGTTFGGTNVSATMNLNSNGLALSLSAPTPGGGGAINVSAGTASGNLQTIQFDNANGVSFGLNGSTVTASVNAGGGGGTESNYFPHKDAIWTPHQVGQNSIQVQPLANVPNVTYDRLAYGVQFSGATNSTMTVSATVQMGLYTLNGSTLSLLTSGSGSFSINGSGTANSTINSGPRWATMTMNAGGSFSGDVWVAFRSSTATSGVNATLSNIMASRVNSSWSGFIGVGTANSVQSLPGMGFYSTTSNGLPSSMALSHITGVSSTAQRPQIFFLSNGAFPI